MYQKWATQKQSYASYSQAIKVKSDYLNYIIFLIKKIYKYINNNKNI